MSTFLSPATGNLVGKKEENSPGGDERVKSAPKVHGAARCIYSTAQSHVHPKSFLIRSC